MLTRIEADGFKNLVDFALDIGPQDQENERTIGRLRRFPVRQVTSAGRRRSGSVPVFGSAGRVGNNRRRILLLERAARLLYREWFINVTWIVPTDVTRNDCLALIDSERKITEQGLLESSATMVPAETILMTSRASVGYFALMDREVCFCRA